MYRLCGYILTHQNRYEHNLQEQSILAMPVTSVSLETSRKADERIALGTGSALTGLPVWVATAPKPYDGAEIISGYISINDNKAKEEALQREKDTLSSRNQPYVSLQGNRGQRTSKAPPPSA
jgi:hypothetical protein